MAYDSSTNALHYITCFLDGLNADIHAVILVQCPDSLDTVYTLALLQEEAEGRRDFRPWNQKGVNPLPPHQDRFQAGAAKKTVLLQKLMDKKLADLKAYLQARRLCDHCGEKWNREHKCATQVGLHVLDKLYALFATEGTVACSTTEEEGELECEETCCCLQADNSILSGVKTLQFKGHFQKQSVLILLGSGSSTSFISQ